MNADVGINIQTKQRHWITARRAPRLLFSSAPNLRSYFPRKQSLAPAILIPQFSLATASQDSVATFETLRVKNAARWGDRLCGDPVQGGRVERG